MKATHHYYDSFIDPSTDQGDGDGAYLREYRAQGRGPTGMERRCETAGVKSKSTTKNRSFISYSYTFIC